MGLGKQPMISCWSLRCVCHPKSQGRIHGNPVADGWAGAVMRIPLGIQKCDGPTDGRTDGWTDRRTDRPTDRHGKM